METAIIKSTLFHRIFLARLLPLLVLAFAAFEATAQSDPPARVANFSHMEGSVAFAPAGETEWSDVQRNRPITVGDRLWTDRGARAELHLGSAVLHLNGRTFLDIAGLDDMAFQARLNEGTVNARVRELERGENFEIDTPQLAFRASQPGDFRIDVDPANNTTRVTVRSGSAMVYGARGEALTLRTGQQVAFAGRDLDQVALPGMRPDDGFDRWAADRNRQEDQSIAARYVPRNVVGYQQLDPYGEWAQDPSYGAVWFPRVAAADWAPYRYGRWDWIAPWGWTWIDDAPWGFAPFHYGRWAVIGTRWCWVPGRIGPRPVYSPALVAFVGSGGGVAWFPLGPGEAWRPHFRASTVYMSNVNLHITFNETTNYVHRHRPAAFTAVRTDDFARGRPVHSNWRRLDTAEVARAQIAAPPSPDRTERRRFGGNDRTVQMQGQAPSLSGPGIASRPQPRFEAPRVERQSGDRARTELRPEVNVRPEQEQRRAFGQREPGERRVEQQRAQEERRAQHRRAQDEQRARQAPGPQRPQRPQRQQQMQQERAQRDQQVQQERIERDRQGQAQRQQEAQREQQAQRQREHAVRRQQALQERQQAAQERAQRHQQAAQERIQHQQEQQQRARPQPQAQREAVVAPQERGGGRSQRRQEAREERRSQADEDGPGRGQGRGGRFN